MEEAKNLIALGKQYLQEEVMKAVDLFQAAAGMLAKQFGEKADECGEAYYWYAVSLLEQERMENRVLGNALVGICVEVEEEKSEDSIVEVTDKLDENAMDDLRAQVYDAMAEREGETKAQKKGDTAAEKDEEKDDNAAEKRDEDLTAEKDPEKAEGNQSNTAEKDEQETVKDEASGAEPNSEEKEETKKEKEPEESKEAEDGEEDEMEVEGDAEGQDGEGTTGKDSDDEVENLQLAWEMLELAKIIYKRKDTKEDRLMLSQIHQKLGEVSAESGNYKDVKEDFDECLNLQLKTLEPDSRLLAETYYNIGLLYANINQHNESAESLSRSIAIINTRLENLQKLIDNAAGPEDLPVERQEMLNLQSLLPDMKTKEAEAIHNAKMAKEQHDEGSSSSAGPATQNQESTAMVNGSSVDENSSEPQATDISHLVRKKRKPESPIECGGKKAKPDETREEEPHTSGTQGQSSGTQGQSGETKSSGTEGQSETQSSGTEGQGSGTQANVAQGQSSGTQSSETTHGQNNGPSNKPHKQGSGPHSEPQGQDSDSPKQSNGPHNNAHGQSSTEGEGN